MPEARPVSRLERFAPWLAGALVSLPIWLAHYPPMADLPLHEAVVGLLRHWGDPKLVPPTLYQLNLGLANQLFYFLILPLAYVVPTGTATKLVAAMTIFLLPVAAGHLADYLGVTRWSTMVIAPIALGWMFFWGLLANMLGLVIYLFALPSLDRFCEQPLTWPPRRGSAADAPSLRGVAAACGLMVLLHFAHEMMALLAAGTIVLFTLFSWRGRRENVARLVPVLLVLGLVWSSVRLAARLVNSYHSTLPLLAFLPLTHKLVSLPGVLYAGYEVWVRTLIFVVCLVPAVLFGIERWKHRARVPAAAAARPVSWREKAHELRFELLGASLLVAYFVAPVNMQGTTFIYHRCLAPAWILLTLTACTRARLAAPWRLPRMLAVFVPLAPLLTAWPRFMDSDRVYTDLDAAIAHMEPGSSYIVVELGPMSPNWLYMPLTGGGHVVAALGGRGFFDFTQSELSPVYQRRQAQWSEAFLRMDSHSYRMMPSYDLGHYRYAILHTPDARVASIGVLALAPDAKMIFGQGEWTVMESTHPLVPIDSPEEHPPTPHPESLRKRFREVAAMIEHAPVSDDALPPEGTPGRVP